MRTAGCGLCSLPLRLKLSPGGVACSFGRNEISLELHVALSELMAPSRGTLLPDKGPQMFAGAHCILNWKSIPFLSGGVFFKMTIAPSTQRKQSPSSTRSTTLTFSICHGLLSHQIWPNKCVWDILEYVLPETAFITSINF